MPVIEESNYYPYGLSIAGISSNALKGSNYVENRLKYNGKELQNKEFYDGSGLEWYDYKNRFYDHQIGRFFCVDKLADKYPYYSPYQFAGNEVPNAIDLDGLEPAYQIGNNFYMASDALTHKIPAGAYVPGTAAASGGWENSKNTMIGEVAIVGAVAAPQYAGLIYRGAKEVIGNEAKENNKAPNNEKLQKLEERAAKLSEKERPGKDFTRDGKEVVKDINKEKNGGTMKCENCKTEVQPGKQHQKGEAPPSNEAHVDHVVPKSQGGSGTPNNGQVLCRECNLKKGAN